MKQIIDRHSKCYKDLHISHDNGAYYYCKEIEDNIIPYIKTDRPWVLLNIPEYCFDRAIVFIHNNKNPERYEWLKNYKDLILICSQINTLKFIIEMLPMHHTILIPLSIDINYVKQFKTKRKTKNIAYFGRMEKYPEEIDENKNIDKLTGTDRVNLLKQVSKYKTVYAIGRCALEAKCLGCKVISHRGEYENTEFNLLDNKEVIPLIQKSINEIDGLCYN